MQTLRRGLEVLQAIKAHQPCGLREIHVATGLAKPTLLRFLSTFEEMGLIFRPVDDNRYRISARNFLRESRGDIRTLLQEAAAPVLRQLCRRVAWPTDVGLRDGYGMSVAASNRSLSPFPIKPSPIDHHADMLLTAVGRAYLAFTTEAEKQEILDGLQIHDPKHPLIGDKAQVAEILAKTRAQGYGVRSETKRDGFSAIAVPILVNDRPVACMNLFYYANAISLRHVVADHLKALQEAAAQISSRIAG